MIIDYLKNHKASIPQLARCSYNEWKAVYESTGMTFDDVVASYGQRANVDWLPLALVALHQGEVIGTGSLKLQDLAVCPHLTPWMGGLFVVEEHRKRGLATALIHRLVLEAERLQIDHLYLWTPSAESLYAKLGWASFERFSYCGYEISLMHRALGN